MQPFQPDAWQIWPINQSGVVTINATKGAYTWAGKTAGLMVFITATIGAYSWSGKTATLSTEITSTKGSYTWAGKTALFSTQISSTKGAYSWLGKTATLGTPTIAAGIGSWAWAGVTSVITTPAVISVDQTRPGGGKKKKRKHLRPTQLFEDQRKQSQETSQEVIIHLPGPVSSLEAVLEAVKKAGFDIIEQEEEDDVLVLTFISKLLQ